MEKEVKESAPERLTNMSIVRLALSENDDPAVREALDGLEIQIGQLQHMAGNKAMLQLLRTMTRYNAVRAKYLEENPHLTEADYDEFADGIAQHFNTPSAG